MAARVYHASMWISFPVPNIIENFILVGSKETPHMFTSIVWNEVDRTYIDGFLMQSQYKVF
jgi:hypothetical protein